MDRFVGRSNRGIITCVALADGVMVFAAISRALMGGIAIIATRAVDERAADVAVVLPTRAKKPRMRLLHAAGAD
jgi:hypothetical protein